MKTFVVCMADTSCGSPVLVTQLFSRAVEYVLNDDYPDDFVIQVWGETNCHGSEHRIGFVVRVADYTSDDEIVWTWRYYTRNPHTMFDSADIDEIEKRFQ